MIIRTRENSKSKFVEYKFGIFEVFYNTIRRLTEQSDRQFQSFNNFNWNSEIIKNKFKNYFEETQKTNFRKLCCSLKCKSDKCFQEIFWTDRGWSKEEAKQKIKEIQSKIGKKFSEKLERDPSIRYTSTQLKYWINKGYNEEDSKNRLKERQNTTSLKKYQKRYGDEKGLELFKKRNEKWIETLCKNFSFEERITWKSWGRSTSSRESNILFLPFYLKYQDIYTCFIGGDKTKKGESSLKRKDNNYGFNYDFTILELKLIFEYNGEHVHPNPSWPQEKWNSWRHCFSHKTADIVHSHYKEKIKLAENKGFRIIQLWSSTSFEENKKIIEKEIQDKIEILQL